jgi:cellulose biosynthesis protein BcsQ
MTGVVLGVLGGSGGVGASSFAGVLAIAALPAVLVDLDVVGGGLDVLLGVEDARGARWSGLRLGGGRLDPQALLDGLPRWRSVPILAADADEPAPEAALQVIDAAGRLATVIADLPRAPSPLRDAVLGRCDLCVVVARSDVREIAAARAVLRSLPDVATGLVLRRGELTAGEAAALIGSPLLGEIPPLDHMPPPARRPSRAATRLAGGVLDGLAA